MEPLLCTMGVEVLPEARRLWRWGEALLVTVSPRIWLVRPVTCPRMQEADWSILTCSSAAFVSVLLKGNCMSISFCLVRIFLTDFDSHYDLRLIESGPIFSKMKLICKSFKKSTRNCTFSPKTCKRATTTKNSFKMSYKFVRKFLRRLFIFQYFFAFL